MMPSMVVSSDGPLVSAAAGDHRRDGLRDDDDLVDGPSLVDVFDVELDLLFEREIAAAADLPEAGQPLGNLQTTERAGVVVLHLAPDGGAGAHQRHVADDDV